MKNGGATLALVVVAIAWSTAVAAVQGLPDPVTRVLAAHGVSSANVSVFVQAVEEDQPFLTFHSDQPRNPASTIKLLTTYVALETLGPAHTWTTDVYLGGPLRGGRVEGDLVMRGGGDPWLTTERFWRLLRDLKARGVEEIAGDLVIDGSYFEVPPHDPGAFDSRPFRAYNVAPTALMVNHQAARFLFVPDNDHGTARVDVDPPLANLEIDNQLQLVSGACRGYQRGIAFDMPAGKAAGKVRLSGRFPAGCSEYALWRSVLTADTFTWGVFRSLWGELGGTITGNWRSGVAPADSRPFLRHSSVSLAEAIRHVNKWSNNAMSRTLLLSIGAEVRDPPGTLEKGRAAIGAWLERHDLADPGLVVDNGSGLSRDTRISAEQLGRVLLEAWRSPYRSEFISSLPLGGIDGTMRKRHRNGSATGRMHIKTGSLDNVSAIAGYVYAASGRHYAVVVMLEGEGVQRGPGREAQDALLEWVHQR